MGHTGHSAVWASQAEDASEDEVLRAQIAANEVSGRLGAALFLRPHNGQFWSTLHCPGAALAGGPLRRLGPEPPSAASTPSASPTPWPSRSTSRPTGSGPASWARTPSS